MGVWDESVNMGFKADSAGQPLPSSLTESCHCFKKSLQTSQPPYLLYLILLCHHNVELWTEASTLS